MSSSYLRSSRSLRPNLSNTLQTKSLASSNELIPKELHSDFESDTSSICHSPCWENNGRKKNKVDKVEKKQRGIDMEKVREKGHHSKIQQSESEKSAARPRKLSKRPPTVKTQSAKTIIGKGFDISHSSPVLQYDRGTTKISSETASPRRNNITGITSRIANNPSVDTTPIQTPDSQPDAGFIGGLKLRREEEASVQQAIRQAKARDRSGNGTISLNKLDIPKNHYHPVATSTERYSLYNESELHSGQSQPQINPGLITVNSPSQSSIYSDDYFSVSKYSSMLRDPLSSQYPWGNESRDDTYREYPCEGNPQSIDATQPYSPSSQTFGGQSPVLRDRGLASDPISTNKISLESETYVSEPYKSNPALEESKRTKSTLSMPSTNKSIHATKQPYSMANDKRALFESRTNSAQEKSFSILGSNGIPRAANSRYSQNSNQKSPNAMYNDVDKLNDLEPSDYRIATDQGTRKQGDINSAQSVMNTAQELQRSLDSNDAIYQFNSGSQLSNAASIDSSEDYYTQDDLSSITTPSESRSHSLRGSSLYENQNETWSAQVAVRLGPLAENGNKHRDRQATNIKSGCQNDNSSIHSNSTSRIERMPNVATIRSTEITPLGIVKDQVEQIYLSSQDSPRPNSISESHYPAQEPIQGLIRRQSKPNNLKKSLNPKTKYEISKCSQYLQEARSRIGSAVSSPGSPSLHSNSPQSTSDPFAKMFVVCCSCKYFHDMPSKLYACMTQPDNLVREESLGVSGVVTTSVKCPWCGHGMSTSCCAGYAAVVYMKERLH